MELWITWWNVIRLLRPAFSRGQTFFWFALTVAAFCVRRDLTNTPLQAFVVMNDPQFVEATRMLAQKVIKQEASFEDRANLVGQLMLARNFETRELEILKQTLETAQKHYKANPEEAKKLITVGQSIADPALDPAELAAWSIIASQVLNLDETLCK